MRQHEQSLRQHPSVSWKFFRGYSSCSLSEQPYSSAYRPPGTASVLLVSRPIWISRFIKDLAARCISHCYMRSNTSTSIKLFKKPVTATNVRVQCCTSGRWRPCSSLLPNRLWIVPLPVISELSLTVFLLVVGGWASEGERGGLVYAYTWLQRMHQRENEITLD